MISIARAPGGYVLESELLLPRAQEAVFPFFADAFNLEFMTPPLLRFHVVMPPPIEMSVGLLIDYKLRIRGIPMRWRGEITAWEPPHHFVDEQRIGPYRRWRHEHFFEQHCAGTLVRDRVEYSVPGGAIVHALFVRGDVRRIFEYRRQVLARLFRDPAPAATESTA